MGYFSGVLDQKIKYKELFNKIKNRVFSDPDYPELCNIGCSFLRLSFKTKCVLFGLLGYCNERHKDCIKMFGEK